MEIVQTAGARGQQWLDIIDAHPRAKLAFDRVEAVTRGFISMTEATVIKETYGVIMRDGLRIPVWVTRPAESGSYYAILHKYYGDGSWHEGDTEGPIDVSQSSSNQSYIYLESKERPGGTRFRSDVEDIADIFKWLETKSWFNGRLGMVGASYGGATQWLATQAKNPILKVIVPEKISPDMWKTCYRQNGALVLAMTAPGRGVNIGSFPTYTPLWTLSLLDMGGNQLWKDYVTNWTFTDYWKKISYRVDGVDGKIAQVQIPTYMVGGWQDNYFTGQIEACRIMREAGNDKTYVWIGRGRHGQTTEPHPNSERDFDTEVNLDIPGIGTAMNPLDPSEFRSDVLSGKHDGKLDVPPYCLFVMGINQHRGFAKWPVPGTHYRNYYLSSPSGDRTGSLTTATPGAEQPSEYDYDPAKPIPTLGGTCTNDTMTEGTGSFDQRRIQDRSDVLVFTSETLSEHIAVVGRIKVKLWASSSGKDTDFIAKLVDVYPDGRAFNVCEGILRARFRNSIYDTPERLAPDQVYAMEIQMHSTASVFLKGHKIQLMIQSSNFPMWDRNLNTGNDPDTDKTIVVAHQQIWHDKDHPTHLVLPVTSDTRLYFSRLQTDTAVKTGKLLLVRLPFSESMDTHPLTMRINSP